MFTIILNEKQFCVNNDFSITFLSIWHAFLCWLYISKVGQNNIFSWIYVSRPQKVFILFLKGLASSCSFFGQFSYKSCFSLGNLAITFVTNGVRKVTVTVKVQLIWLVLIQNFSLSRKLLIFGTNLPKNGISGPKQKK